MDTLRRRDHTIPICRTDEDVGRAYQLADRTDRPHLFVLLIDEGYARVECDMMTAGTDLAGHAVEAAARVIEDALERAAADPAHTRSITRRGCCCNPGIVYVEPLRVPTAKETAVDLADVVLDRKNWVAPA